MEVWRRWRGSPLRVWWWRAVSTSTWSRCRRRWPVVKTWSRSAAGGLLARKAKWNGKMKKKSMRKSGFYKVRPRNGPEIEEPNNVIWKDPSVWRRSRYYLKLAHGKKSSWLAWISEQNYIYSEIGAMCWRQNFTRVFIEREETRGADGESWRRPFGCLGQSRQRWWSKAMWRQSEATRTRSRMWLEGVWIGLEHDVSRRFYKSSITI